MYDYISQLFGWLEDKLTQVSVLKFMNRRILPVLFAICVIGGFVAILAMFGVVGTWDYYSEIKEVQPANEEIISYITIGISLALFALSCVAGFFVNRVMEWNEEMIDWRKRQERLAFERELRRVISEVISEHEREEREFLKKYLA